MSENQKQSTTNSTEHAGNSIVNLAVQTGGYAAMDQDNKDMLQKIRSATTHDEVLNTLMKDPNTGKQLSYAESRMRFG